MSGIIRNSGFIYFYPPFEPQLWILYEIAEYALTSVGGVPLTGDIAPFLEHVKEMLEVGVQPTLIKHGHRCSYDRDRRYLISWLELLVPLKKSRVNIDLIRTIMDHIIWHPLTGVSMFQGVELRKFEGTCKVYGEVHTFTPFPERKTILELETMRICRPRLPRLQEVYD